MEGKCSQSPGIPYETDLFEKKMQSLYQWGKLFEIINNN